MPHTLVSRIPLSELGLVTQPPSFQPNWRLVVGATVLLLLITEVVR